MKDVLPSSMHDTLSTAFDLILLNGLWLVCSIPIVTIGASTTALYTATIAISSNEGVVFRRFFISLKKDFKRATLLWMLMLLAGLVILADAYIISNYWSVSSRYILLGILALCAVLLSLTAAVLFPILSQTVLPPLRTLQHAFILGLRFLPRSFAMATLSLLPLALALLWFYAFLATLMMWVLIGFSLIAYINAFFARPIVEELSKIQRDKGV